MRLQQFQIVLGAGLCLYLGLITFSVLTKGAWCDEGWYGAPARELALHGSMGTPNLYGLKGVRQHTYWEMPGYIVALAGWMKVAGTGLVRARALNILLGACSLLLWFAFLRLMGWKRTTAALAASLTGADMFFLTDAGWLRADMLSLALGLAAYTVYLALRERRLQWAVGAAFTFAVAAGLTHPNGGLLALIGLGILMVRDRAQLRPVHLLFAAMPALVGAAIWGAYILQAPHDFMSQFSVNAQGRFRPILHPFQAIVDEVQRRYLLAFGLGAHDAATPKSVILKAVVLAAYAVSAIAALAVAARRKAPSCLRISAAMFAGYLFFYTFLEGTRTTYYLTWVVPFYCAFLAWAVGECCNRRGATRAAACAAVFLVIAVDSAATIKRADQEPRLESLRDVTEYLRNSGGTNAHTIASSELGFALGFAPGRYTDDETFGLQAGVRPKRIVVSPRFEDEVLKSPQRPAFVAARNYLGSNCALTYDRDRYRVYDCKP